MSVIKDVVISFDMKIRSLFTMVFAKRQFFKPVKPISGTLKGRSGIKKNGDKGQSVKICVPQYPGRNVFPFKNSERFERTRNERERERMVIQRPLVQRYITDLSCKFQYWNTHQRNCRLRVSPFFSNFESS